MMRAVRAIAIGLGLLCAACSGPTPTAPSGGRPAARSGSGFGVLLPAEGTNAAPETFASCLSGARSPSCFNAAVAAAPRVVFSSAGLAARIGRVGPASVADGIPDAPTNLIASTSAFGASTTVYLSWRAPTTAPAPAGYFIEAGSATGLSDIAAFATGSTSTFYSTNVSGGGTFYVRVRAVGSGGASLPSNEVVVTVRDARIPSAPCCITVNTVGSTVTISWFYSSFFGAAPTSYVIQASSAAGGPADLANFATGSTQTSFSATGVAPGTYFLRVLAANSFGIGPPSDEVSLIVVGPTPCSTAPSAPTNLVAFVSGSTVTLGWSVSTGLVTSYVVEAGSGPGLANLATADTGSSNGSAIFAGVSRGTYYVRVRAKNSCGVGGASNEIIVVVQ